MVSSSALSGQSVISRLHLVVNSLHYTTAVRITSWICGISVFLWSKQQKALQVQDHHHNKEPRVKRWRVTAPWQHWDQILPKSVKKASWNLSRASGHNKNSKMTIKACLWQTTAGESYENIINGQNQKITARISQLKRQSPAVAISEKCHDPSKYDFQTSQVLLEAPQKSQGQKQETWDILSLMRLPILV